MQLDGSLPVITDPPRHLRIERGPEAPCDIMHRRLSGDLKARVSRPSTGSDVRSSSAKSMHKCLVDKEQNETAPEPGDRNEFSRGSLNRTAKLFNPKKDKIPLIKKKSASAVGQPADRRPNKVIELKQDPAVSKKPRNDLPRRVARRTVPQEETSAGFSVNEAYQRWKQTVVVPVQSQPRGHCNKARMQILQNPASDVNVPEIIRELRGPEYDDHAQISEAHRLHAASEDAEAVARDSIEQLQSGLSSDKNLDEQVLRTISDHRALLDIYYDFLVLTQHPAASDTLKKLPTSYKLLERLWSMGLDPVIEGLCRVMLSNAPESQRRSEICDLLSSFLYHSYAVFASLIVCVPSMKVDWYESLGRLAIGMNVIEQTDSRGNLISSDWTGTAIKWYRQAARYRPEVGEYYARLYHLLPQSELINRLYLLRKAGYATIPAIDLDKNGLYEFLDWTLKESDALEPCPDFGKILIAYESALHISSVSPDRENAQRTLLEQRTSTKESAKVSFIHCCDLHEFAPAHNLEWTQEQLGDARNAKMGGSLRPTESIPCFTAMEALRQACQADEGGALIDLYIWLAYLIYASEQPYWKSIFNLIPWPSLALAINEQTKSEFFTSDTFHLSQLPMISHEDLPGLLPEDTVIRGSIFAQNTWPEHSFRGVEIDDEEDILMMSSNLQLAAVRGERVLWLGYRLWYKCDVLEFDEAAQTFVAPEPALGNCVFEADSGQRIRADYTTVVCDATVLMHEMRLVELALDKNLTVVIPLVALKELDKLEHKAVDRSTKIGSKVRSVIARIELLLKSRNLKVVASDGSSLKDLSFRNRIDSEEIDDFDDKVICAVKHEKLQHPVERGCMRRDEKCHLTVLMSLSQGRRVRAIRSGISAVSAARLRSVVVEAT